MIDNDLKELAELLNGREYGDEMVGIDEKSLKDKGIVVVFGYSDDLVELYGAIKDELDAYNGTELLVNRFGDVMSIHDDNREQEKTSYPINVKWIEQSNDYCWIIETDIPHYEFDIFDEGLKFCRGIVFKLRDIPIPLQYIQDTLNRLKDNDVNGDVLNWIRDNIELSDKSEITWKIDGVMNNG